MELIDKSALVAEINKRIKECDKLADAAADNNLHSTLEANELLIRQYKSLLYFLDTLEVKEVDLEKYYHDFLQKEWFDKDCNRTISEMMAFTAKHFYELGLKVVQKGE